MFDTFAPTRRAMLRLGAIGAGALAASATSFRFAAAQGDKIRVVITNAGGGSIMVHQQLLKDLGYLEEFGLDATIENVTDGSKVIASLLGGSSDLCLLAGIQPVIPAIAKGAALKIVAGSNLLPAFAFVTGKEDIKTAKDLEGRNVGVGTPGALTSVLTSVLLEKLGADVSKVSFVNVGNTADILKAMVAGTVDAGLCEIGVFMQRQRYGLHLIEGGEVWKALPEFTFQGSFTSERAIGANREGIVRVLAAQAKLIRFLESPESRDAYIKARLTALKSSTEAEAIDEWTYIQENRPYAEDLIIPEERIDYMQKLNVQLGRQAEVLPYDKICDMSLAKDAVALLDKA